MNLQNANEFKSPNAEEVFGANSLEEKLLELRLTEIETRKRIQNYVGQMHGQKGWRELGYRSLTEFCSKSLSYEASETREILRRLQIILPADSLVSTDPEVQKRIEALKAWRRRKSSRRGWASFRIITNRTLLLLAEKQPRNIDELAKVPGIGPTKLQDFGEELLSCLPRSESLGAEALSAG